MNSREKPRRKLLVARLRRERGFAYLMALFLVMVVIITSQVAAENLLTAGRRAREEDMIWRGNQYIRAIRLYYKKTGHYPQDFEQLQKGQPELHFLRFAALKDPMSKTDGEWGFIYVNATGQIFGSVKYASLQQMALLDLNGGQMPGGPALEGAGAGIEPGFVFDLDVWREFVVGDGNPSWGEPGFVRAGRSWIIAQCGPRCSRGGAAQPFRWSLWRGRSGYAEAYRAGRRSGAGCISHRRGQQVEPALYKGL